MDTQSKTALAKCNLFIKKNITNFGEVIDYLLQEGCLNWDERGRIGTEKSIGEQCQILLEILIRRGGSCYDGFLDALASSGNNHIVDEIENTANKIYLTDKKTESLEGTLGEKNKNLEEMKFRINELEGKLKLKKDKLVDVNDQQLRALDDLRRLKDKNNHKDVDINKLEMKNHDMEKEIDRLKQIIDYLQKQIVLKDEALKRAESDQRKMTHDHIRVLQNLERKQDQTHKTCEKLSDNVSALTKAFVSLHNEVKRPQQKDVHIQGPAELYETAGILQPKRGSVRSFNKTLRAQKISNHGIGGMEKQKGARKATE